MILLDRTNLIRNHGIHAQVTPPLRSEVAEELDVLEEQQWRFAWGQ